MDGHRRKAKVVRRIRRRLTGRGVVEDWFAEAGRKIVNEFANPNSVLNAGLRNPQQLWDKIRNEFENPDSLLGQAARKAGSDFSNALDPEKNGVAEAFRKFGKDTKEAFEEIGRKATAAFSPENLATMESELKRIFVDEPGLWIKENQDKIDQAVEIIGYIALAVAITSLVVVTAGAAAPALASTIGVATATSVASTGAVVGGTTGAVAVAAVGTFASGLNIANKAQKGEKINPSDWAGLVVGAIPGISTAGFATKAGVRTGLAASQRAAEGATFAASRLTMTQYIGRTATALAKQARVAAPSAITGAIVGAPTASKIERAKTIGGNIVQTMKATELAAAVDDGTATAEQLAEIAQLQKDLEEALFIQEMDLEREAALGQTQKSTLLEKQLTPNSPERAQYVAGLVGPQPPKENVDAYMDWKHKMDLENQKLDSEYYRAHPGFNVDPSLAARAQQERMKAILEQEAAQRRLENEQKGIVIAPLTPEEIEQYNIEADAYGFPHYGEQYVQDKPDETPEYEYSNPFAGVKGGKKTHSSIRMPMDSREWQYAMQAKRQIEIQQRAKIQPAERRPTLYSTNDFGAVERRVKSGGRKSYKKCPCGC